MLWEYQELPMLPHEGMLIMCNILSPKLRQSLGFALYSVFVQSVTSRSGQANILGEVFNVRKNFCYL